MSIVNDKQHRDFDYSGTKKKKLITYILYSFHDFHKCSPNFSVVVLYETTKTKRITLNIHLCIKTPSLYLKQNKFKTKQE